MTERVQTKSRDIWLVWLLVIVITTVAMVMTYRTFVGEPIPTQITLASGSETGAYHWYAKQYAKLIEEKSGIKVTVQTTAGSAENLELLQNDDRGVSLAFLQSGIAPSEIQNVQALMSVNHEPLWVFFDKREGLQSLAGLKGQVVAIGSEGGGTRPVALKLLADNGVVADNTTFSDLSGMAAAGALQAGEVRAVMYVAALKGEYVQALLNDPAIGFLDFKRYASYERRYDFLSAVAMPEGLLSLQKNSPEYAVHVLAMNTMLVSRTDLHPALIPLLLDIGREVHKKGSLLDPAGTFPAAKFNGLPGNKDAEKYFRKGPSFLHGIMSFQMATSIDRLKVMIVPLLTLLLPLFKLTPPIYRWRMRAKIYRWYERVREQDLRIVDGVDQETLRDIDGHLHTLEQDLKKVKVPLSFMEELYQLQTHISLLQGKVDKLTS